MIVHSKYATSNAQFLPGVATVASFEIYMRAVLAKLCRYQTDALLVLSHNVCVSGASLQ